MATYTFDFRKTQPAKGGARRDHIAPGKYKMRVADYSDKASNAGKEMHTFTSVVVGKGPEAGKQIVDRFAMPKTARDSQFPVERLLSFFMACGAKTALGKQFKYDPAKLKGKEYVCEIVDQYEEARTENGTTYPARTVSGINRYIFNDEDEDEDEEDDEDAEDDDEDEDDEDSDDDEEEEDDEEDEDEDEDEDDEDEEEEEEEVPAPKARRSTKKAAEPEPPARKAKAKAPAAAPAKKASKRKAKDDDDDEDFPFE